MELRDYPSLSQRPHASQPDPTPARLLMPWYQQHRDLGWEPLAQHHEDPLPGQHSQAQGCTASMASDLPSSWGRLKR